MLMSKYLEKALELHSKGYNCAQSVVCAFSDAVEADEKILYKISEGFGAGIGNGKNTCGALSGAVMLSGLYSSKGDISVPSKKDTYRISGNLVDEFEEKCGAVACCDIKKNKCVSCDECIKIAVESVEKHLYKE